MLEVRMCRCFKIYLKKIKTSWYVEWQNEKDDTIIMLFLIDVEHKLKVISFW